MATLSIADLDLMIFEPKEASKNRQQQENNGSIITWFCMMMLIRHLHGDAFKSLRNCGSKSAAMAGVSSTVTSQLLLYSSPPITGVFRKHNGWIKVVIKYVRPGHVGNAPRRLCPVATQKMNLPDNTCRLLPWWQQSSWRCGCRRIFPTLYWWGLQRVMQWCDRHPGD